MGFMGTALAANQSICYATSLAFKEASTYHRSMSIATVSSQIFAADSRMEFIGRYVGYAPRWTLHPRYLGQISTALGGIEKRGSLALAAKTPS